MKFSFLAQDEEQFTKETAIKSRDQFQNLYSLKSKSNCTRIGPIKNKMKEAIQEPLIEESYETFKDENENNLNQLEDKE